MKGEPEEVAPFLSEQGFELVSLPPGTEPESGRTFRFESRGALHDLVQGEKTASRGQPVALLLELMNARFHALCAQREDLTFLIADTVLTPDGQAIVLAGRGINGKSRLAGALIEQGASPYSAGLTPVDESGLVYPYPARSKPSEGVQARAILMVDFVPGAVWDVEELSAGQAAAYLSSLLMEDMKQMGQALPRLAKLSTGAEFLWRGTRGEALEAGTALFAEGVWE